MIKVVLFDIDGTLIHSGGAGVKAFKQAFTSEFGIEDGTQRIKFAGRTDVSLVRESFGNHGVEASPENFARFFEAYLGWLRQIILESAGGACQGVAEYHRKLLEAPKPPAIGLLTGNIKRGAEVKLGHYGWWDKFAFGGFADDSELREEIAEAARKRASEHLGREIRGEETLVIGDTPLDIRCGRAIGARVLAVATGGATMEELAVHKPDILVADLSEANVEESLA